MIVTPPRNGASKTSIARAEDVGPGVDPHCRLTPQRARPTMKLVESRRTSGSPPPIRQASRVSRRKSVAL